jgi:hypothetical protein
MSRDKRWRFTYVSTDIAASSFRPTVEDSKCESEKKRIFKYLCVLYWKFESKNNLKFTLFNYFSFKYHVKSPCTTFLKGHGNGLCRPRSDANRLAS